jgi:hypothetical protein
MKRHIGVPEVVDNELDFPTGKTLQVVDPLFHGDICILITIKKLLSMDFHGFPWVQPSRTPF